MDDLFAPNPTDNVLPYDGQLYDWGLIDLSAVGDSYDDLYRHLLTTLPWQSDVVTLFGKTHITKRQVVWMGDNGENYHYSGHTHQAIEWHPIVFQIKRIIEKQCLTLGGNNGERNATDNNSAYFNTCLLNYYPSGSEGMGYHADDEKELGTQPLIAALSLGASRKMIFKHKKTQNKVSLYLASGQLIIMAGMTQQHWKHSITKTKTVNEGRISLTFRHMLTS